MLVNFRDIKHFSGTASRYSQHIVELVDQKGQSKHWYTVVYGLVKSIGT